MYRNCSTNPQVYFLCTFRVTKSWTEPYPVSLPPGLSLVPNVWVYRITGSSKRIWSLYPDHPWSVTFSSTGFPDDNESRFVRRDTSWSFWDNDLKRSLRYKNLLSRHKKYNRVFYNSTIYLVCFVKQPDLDRNTQSILTTSVLPYIWLEINWYKILPFTGHRLCTNDVMKKIFISLGS